MKAVAITTEKPSAKRRHLRVVREVARPERCPSCRGVLDGWECELARAARLPLDCAGCGAVLV